MLPAVIRDTMGHKGDHFMKYLLPTISVIIWILFLILGIHLSMSVYEQQISGYPNVGQILYYIGFPSFMAVILGAIIAFAKRIRSYIVSVFSLVSLACLPVYLFFYTGGV